MPPAAAGRSGRDPSVTSSQAGFQGVELLRVDVEDWLAEVPSIEEHFAGYGDKVPAELHKELQALHQRLQQAG